MTSHPLARPATWRFLARWATVGTLIAPLLGCATLWQGADTVAIREPGERVLGVPTAIKPEASKHWEFAWLSEAAYRNVKGGEARAADDKTACGTADEVLGKHGWTRWEKFPDDGLLKEISDSGLRVEVWEKREPAMVVVAFGGTIFTSGKDWRSNLRWFIPEHHDEYTDIVERFGPAFIGEYQTRMRAPGGQHLKGAVIASTGHSLGGGLAQQFAYALPINDVGLRVDTVYAFDPSPVTGYYSVPADLRERNQRSLSIDRIYERGEILAILRSITSLFVTPSAVDPKIRGVRYAVFYPALPITGHSMPQLACKLQAASGN